MDLTALEAAAAALRAEVATLQAQQQALGRALPGLGTREARTALKTQLARTGEALERSRRDLVALERLLRDLRVRVQSGNKMNMLSAARVRVSAGRHGADKFREALNSRGFTLRSLAEAVGVTHGLLSQARGGTRSLSRSVAEKIEALTGWPASSWPRVRS